MKNIFKDNLKLIHLKQMAKTIPTVGENLPWYSFKNPIDISICTVVFLLMCHVFIVLYIVSWRCIVFSKLVKRKVYCSWFHETLATPIARLVGNLGTINTRSSSRLETGQSNSEVSHQIIEIRYEIPNQVRKQVRKLQTILTVNFKN
jgi:hypothetical protein